MPDTIDDLIVREGGFRDKPGDPGGRTDKGISERSNPEAWADGKVTNDEAREIYLRKYLHGPKIDQISDRHLQEFVLDFGVHSGPEVAIQYLQRALGVTADGVIGPQTIGALSGVDPKLLQNRLVDARLLMCIRIVQKNPRQLGDLGGWANRILGFRRE